MSTQPKLLVFEFDGRYMEDGGNHESDEDSYTALVYSLNQASDEIASEIQMEVSRLLPPSIKVYANITFRSGSITLNGILTVFDWMARADGVIGFSAIVYHVAKFAIERTVSKYIAQHNTIRGMGTVEVDLKQVDSEPETKLSQDAPQPQWRSRVAFNPGILPLSLSLLNTALLVILIVIQFLR